MTLSLVLDPISSVGPSKVIKVPATYKSTTYTRGRKKEQLLKHNYSPIE